MQYVPFNYEAINVRAGTYNPSPVKAYDNLTYAYWQRSLFQRACSILDFSLPATWQGAVRDFFLYCLYRNGYVCVFNPPEFGLSFQPCNISGKDFYYQPTTVTISNPVMSEKQMTNTYTIGEDCELIKLTPDYLGVWDIISRYAEMLSQLDNSINMSLINSKLAYILGATSKSAAEAIKKALDKVNKGEPAVVVDTKIMKSDPNQQEPWQLIDFEVKKNLILPDLLEAFQSLKNDFDSEIGIPTLPYQKKERLVTQEATMRSIDGQSRSQVWYETLTSSLEVVNKHFGSDLSVRLRYDAEEVFSSGDNDDIRP